MTATTRATPALLWSRAALVAVVVVAVSTIGHVSADGLLPGPLAFVGLVLAATAVSARFLTHQASTRRVVGLLVAGQTVIHGVLSALAGHADDPVAVMPRPDLAHQVEHITEQSPWMVLGHLAAVVVLGVWLAVGERALWTFLCLATSTVVDAVVRAVANVRAVLLERVRARVERPAQHATRRHAVPRPWLLRHVVAHRGPPVLLAA